MSSLSPLDAYRERLADRRSALDTQRSRDGRLSNLRLLAFALGAGAAGLAVAGSAPGWLVVPFAAWFVALLIRHDAVIRDRERLERSVDFYERGLARIEDRWAGRGRSGNRYFDPSHPYAGDLDLFGRGSLYERLCAARTAAGQDRLAQWLLAPAEPGVIRLRQEAVEELRNGLDLREELDLVASVASRKVEPDFLERWAASPAPVTPRTARVAFIAVGAATAASALLWLAGYGIVPFLVTAACGQVLRAVWRRVSSVSVKGTDHAALELSELAPALASIERTSFGSPLLRDLAVGMAGGSHTAPTSAIRRLQTLDGYLQMRGNFLTGPMMELFLLTPLVAAGIGDWRRAFGPGVSAWIDAVGEFESLNAVASYAYENPGDPFPHIVDDGPLFRATGIAHPLVPGAVRNDLTLDSDRRLYVVSGSNMSGKSTLLRAVGINALLAQMGAPVRATHLSMSPLRLGASIRTQDSLQEGVSRFYAEILRLRAIVELASEGSPALFLLDEILHGTNSHDRLIGAEAVARALLERGAVGLLTTHDLALARIAEDPPAKALNVHFEDALQDGKMSFDYRLRPGVVEKSNALELMRAVGLEV